MITSSAAVNGSAEDGLESNGHCNDTEDAQVTEEWGVEPSASDNGSDNDSDGDSGEEQTEQRNESGAETSEPAGDSEYELSREEPQSPSAQEWKVILMKAEFAEDLCDQIRKMKPYERCERTGRIITTKSFRNLIQGFCLFLDCGTKVIPKVMKNLTRQVFACCDLLFEICRVLPDQLLVPPKVLATMIPYITDNVLDKLDEPHKTADFFFKAFDKGDLFAILSLGAIFKLIVSHNL
ncbi:unnamed protein product [Heligmosomoides polygyrus]|uniref:MIF4G domain-containing protein n=1 Tax=Heligmosomoides polygyrus TaxID=6339 RepID=A0A183FS41_HELPZ|nr:unnamed protein product [Heligmosomoides polygyrus]